MTTTVPSLPTVNAAAEALAQSLEAMAFISLAPVDGPPPPLPAEVLYVRLAFRGPVGGELVLLAPRALGHVLVENVDVERVAGPCSDAQADDALRECANVVCGRMLRDVPGKFSLGLPRTSMANADEHWAAFAIGGDVIILEAEGVPVGVRLTLDL